MKLRRRWRRRRRIVEAVGEQRFAFDLVIRGILIFQRLRTSRWMDLRMVEDLGFHFCAGDRYMLIFVCGCRFTQQEFGAQPSERHIRVIATRFLSQCCVLASWVSQAHSAIETLWSPAILLVLVLFGTRGTKVGYNLFEGKAVHDRR